MNGRQEHEKTSSIIYVIIFTIIFISLNFCFALHDDEAIGKGGAWGSDDIKTDHSVSSGNEESIDRKFDETFKKSPYNYSSHKERIR